MKLSRYHSLFAVATLLLLVPRQTHAQSKNATDERTTHSDQAPYKKKAFWLVAGAMAGTAAYLALRPVGKPTGTGPHLPFPTGRDVERPRAGITLTFGRH
jgi:hypothetical protein